MSDRRSNQVDGFDYIANRPVSMTRGEWQEKYPPAIYRRSVEDGETFYHRIAGGRLVAEAYSNVPAIRPTVRRDVALNLQTDAFEEGCGGDAVLDRGIR